MGTNAKNDDGKKKVAVIDDHPIVRQGLSELIANQGDLAVCGEAEDAAGALKMIGETGPDLAVVDISLKDSSGIELIKDLKVDEPDWKGLTDLEVRRLKSAAEQLIHMSERADQVPRRNFASKNNTRIIYR